MTIEVDFPSRPEDKFNPHSTSHTRSSSLTATEPLSSTSSTSSTAVTKLSSLTTLVTLPAISAVCRHRADQYETAVINDVLHLSYQAYSGIEDGVFASFATLHTLYLDHNKLTTASLAALSSAPLLTALFLHSNHITSLAALPLLERLRTLNVSENALTDLQGVEQLTSLVTLDASHNAIAAIEPIDQLHSLRDLLLSHNCITATPSPIPTLAALPTLRVLHLHHNPIVTQQPAYRRTLLSQLRAVQWLDERGVQEEERVGVDGWKENGMHGEREARNKLQDAKREKDARNWQLWKESRAAHKAEHEKRVSYSSIKHAIEDEESGDHETHNEKAQPDEAVALSTADTSSGDDTTHQQSSNEPTTHPLSTVSDASDEYHVMRSLSIDQYYQSIQHSVPSAAHIMSDSDDDDDEDEAATDVEIPSAVPFLLGITPALPIIPVDDSSESSIPSATASPHSSSPSSSLPLSLSASPIQHSREPSELMSALVLSFSQPSFCEEKSEEKEQQPQLDCRVQVGRVLAMLSEEAATGQSASSGAVREANVSEQDSDSEAEEEAQWVSYGVESSDEDDASHSVKATRR